MYYCKLPYFIDSAGATVCNHMKMVLDREESLQIEFEDDGNHMENLAKRLYTQYVTGEFCDNVVDYTYIYTYHISRNFLGSFVETFAKLDSDNSSAVLIIIITFILPVQCGGRKTSPLLAINAIFISYFECFCS